MRLAVRALQQRTLGRASLTALPFSVSESRNRHLVTASRCSKYFIAELRRPAAAPSKAKRMASRLRRPCASVIIIMNRRPQNKNRLASSPLATSRRCVLRFCAAWAAATGSEESIGVTSYPDGAIWPCRRLRAASMASSERLRLRDGGSRAQVKTRFLRFLDLDSRVHRQEHSEEASPNADERRFKSGPSFACLSRR